MITRTLLALIASLTVSSTSPCIDAATLSAPSLSNASSAPVAPLQDCNNNGIEDIVDIEFGSSSDADRNGVPDECEISFDPGA